MMDFAAEFNYQFACVTLEAGTSNADNCGANGLPVTASSITMHGNFMALIQCIKHDHLVQYLSSNRRKHEKVMIVFEHYTDPLPLDNIEKILTESLIGLYYLHYEIGCIHGLITPSCILYDSHNDCIKLNHWALNVITECGSLLDADALLPHDCRFVPLEQVMGLRPCRKSDVWSLALSMLSLMGNDIAVIPENPNELITCESSHHVLEKLKVDFGQMSQKMINFFNASLNPHPSSRANVKQLMTIFDIPIPSIDVDPLDRMIRFNKLSINGVTKNGTHKYKSPLSVSHVYHLWCLAFPHDDDDDNGTKRRPPILSLPNLHHNEKAKAPLSGTDKNNKKLVFLPKKLKILSMDKLKDRLRALHPSIFCPLILTPGHNSFESMTEQTSLPLVIRESDFNYQCERIMLFKRLIDGWPFVRANLLQAAKVDIPPYYRAHVWASMLNVKWSDMLIYDRIDKISSTSTDRQISVDIPRCHQYNDLLASPKGHIKLTRILKAWLTRNESNGCVYWQGLDSLASPFVILNFNNEPQAFACFNAFINKYLRGFFVRDNSRVIQEYLALFSQLIAFHDPELFNHLQELCLFPDLYAIPWFLTMFTHVLPLYKTMHIWDTLLLGDESFALYLGLAILVQLRDQLLQYSFNECILIFSDLPEINIDRCAKDAIKHFCGTPKSVTKRGVKPIEQLQTETAPRIDIDDVISLVKNEKTKIKIVDTRSDDEITRFGAFHGAIRVEDFDQFSINGHLIVIVNDQQKATQLINENISRVCSLHVNGYIPNELLG